MERKGNCSQKNVEGTIMKIIIFFTGIDGQHYAVINNIGEEFYLYFTETAKYSLHNIIDNDEAKFSSLWQAIQFCHATLGKVYNVNDIDTQMRIL